MKNVYLTLIASIAAIGAFAQPSEAEFPDFTHTDISGVEHNLYSYLAEGKTVIIDVFATWCPNCVSSIPGLEAIYDEYGPNGDNTIVVLAFERDSGTNNEAAWAANNGVQSPIIAEAPALVSNTWGITYQPNYFIVCPDRSWEMRAGGIGSNSGILLDLVDNCQAVVSVGEEFHAQLVSLKSTLVIDQLAVTIAKEGNYSAKILDQQGRIVKEITLNGALNQVDVNDLASGNYLLQIHSFELSKVLRFIKE